MTPSNFNRTLFLGLLASFLGALALLGFNSWSPLLQQLAIAIPENFQTTIAQFQPANSAAPIEANLVDDVSIWQWLAIAFTTVFVAEMGDKTQLATMLMSAQGKSPWGIFFGSASALVAASLVSVTLGGWLSTLIPPQLLQAIAGVSFILLGLYVLWAEFTGTEDKHCVEIEDEV